MTSLPLVTVITPAYNVGKYIGETVASVLAQADPRFEYLIVDDGSTDDTREVVDKAVSGDSRVRLIDGSHKGSGAARNLGIKEAQGKYIAFLDGDDRWAPKFLESQLQLIESLGNDVGVVFCRSKVILEGGQLAGARYQRTGRFDLDDLLVLNCPPRNGSSLLMKKTVFDDAGLFNEEMKSAIDFDMWLRIASESATPYFWGNGGYLVDMRLRPGSISRDRSARYNALENLLETYSKQMRRLHPGMAYARPATFAFRDGEDEIGERWAAKVLPAGTATLLKDSYGRRVLVWIKLNRTQRQAMRRF